MAWSGDCREGERQGGRLDRVCIWMSAGLVRYKLCDREFDCERCPLDAALRGGPDSRGAPSSEAACFVPVFPEDRRYAPGHLWVAEGKAGARVGLDSLAVALLGTPGRVSWAASGRALAAGAAAATLEMPYGAVPLGLPVSGRALRHNAAVEARPGLLPDDPYGAGWLLEVEGAGPGGVELVDAVRAREEAGLDLRHFRRAAALRLLTDADAVGPTMADGGQALTDLRRILGARRYLGLVRELVH
jgi:glycine cleavage system H protein